MVCILHGIPRSTISLWCWLYNRELMAASSHCFNFCLTIPEVLWRTAHFLLSTLPVHNCTKIWATHFCWDRCPPKTAVKCCAVMGKCLWIKPLNIVEMKLHYYWTCHARASINFFLFSGVSSILHKESYPFLFSVDKRWWGTYYLYIVYQLLVCQTFNGCQVSKNKEKIILGLKLFLCHGND